ncbi:hypothetical protein CLV24_12370 [Pontibacter ummariensis]|uniref:DUF4178 domain-containing protein n=2 Tax=Pontibacter ummariensis TaxID=1610492 RepID=A0A239JT21_9BACT|nr:hypothetical protein CLV24_12370 [Pontibacter ummariensis]SNT09031.1 hypothetical protein SAMN06296052_12370 [Pontibacter ummariensis]
MATALVCSRCQSINRRASLDVGKLPKAEPVKEDMSIIRPATTGQYQGISFEVLGRIQYFFKEGYRNHWYILTGKGEEMWLGEWAGNYSLFKEIPPSDPKVFKKAEPGSILTLANAALQVELLDEEQATYLEGEIPDSNTQEHHFISLELLQPDTFGMGIANIYSPTRVQVYVGQYQYLEDLQLQNLRAHHEWI